jgi:hypothetical protein
MKKKFTLYCISPDGACVVEGDYGSVDAAWERSSDMGSRWYFYPVHVVTSGKTIRGIPDGMDAAWKGRKLSTLCKAFAKDEQHVCDYVNGEAPLLLLP